MTTIEIPGIEPATRKLDPIEFWDSVKTVAKKTGEAGACNHTNLIKISGIHPFVDAAYKAFNNHYPLSISPDDINILIGQGLATHINQNAEELRPKIVAHEGKVEIIVRRDDFRKGVAANPWQEVFPAFTSQIKEHLVGDIYDLTVGDFSTTGPIEKAASEIVLLDAVQSYFKLTFVTCCGIPRFTLTGTPEDWQRVRERALKLNAYGLDWWVKELMPLLDEFVNASSGTPDVNFWKSFFKENSGSGGPYIGGHITRLFPYLYIIWDKKVHKNSFRYEGCMEGATTDAFPGGLSMAPFNWEYYDKIFPMEFVAGFVGVGQDADLTLRPVIGWVVRDAG